MEENERLDSAVAEVETPQTKAEETKSEEVRKPKFVAFSTQKGGVGKTTLTVLAASYLHYAKGFNVAVIDCDYPQHSIVNMRQRDMDLVMKDEHYKQMAFRQFKQLNRKAYPVIACKPEMAIAEADKLLGMSLDYIFFDLPGTINNAAIVRTLACLEYIFIPICADRLVMESSIKFATVINETLISTGKSRIRGLYMLWNFVDRREVSDLYDIYENVMAKFGLQVMETGLPDSKRFRKELSEEHKPLFRSTLFPSDRSLVKGSSISDMIEEMLSLMH